MKTANIVLIILIALSFTMSIYFYPSLPDQVASHWNARGDVDDYMGKFWGIFLIPIMILGLVLLFIALPYIDPLKKNIAKFRKHYDLFIIIFVLFMLAVNVQVIIWNIGIKVSPNIFMPIGIGILIFYIGVLCEHAKQNWFIGIRTPWTLSSEKVWDKTHKLGAKMFKVSGVICLAGAFFKYYAIWFVLVPVLFTSLYTVVYSYIEYRKIKR